MSAGWMTAVGPVNIVINGLVSILFQDAGRGSRRRSTSAPDLANAHRWAGSVLLLPNAVLDRCGTEGISLSSPVEDGH